MKTIRTHPVVWLTSLLSLSLCEVIRVIGEKRKDSFSLLLLPIASLLSSFSLLLLVSELLIADFNKASSIHHVRQCRFRCCHSHGTGQSYRRPKVGRAVHDFRLGSKDAHPRAQAGTETSIETEVQERLPINFSRQSYERQKFAEALWNKERCQ
jgi:hypothetical protein